MEWVLAALAVVVIALAAVAATGWGGGMPDLVDDRVAPDLPPGELTADELRDVQFAVVPRGYSMAQVDALLERLAEERDLRGPVADDTFEVDLPRGLPPVAYGPRPTGEQPPPR